MAWPLLWLPLWHGRYGMAAVMAMATVMAAVIASCPTMGPSHDGIVPLWDVRHFGVFRHFGARAVNGVAVNGVAVDGMYLEPALKPALNLSCSQLGSHPDKASTLGKLSLATVAL